VRRGQTRLSRIRLTPHVGGSTEPFPQDIGVERMLFRGLYNLTDDGDGGVSVEPAMAAAEPEVAGNVYTVTLKDDIKWSDGEPVTAQHFVDGAVRACTASVASPYQYLMGEGFLDLVGCGELFANTDAAQEEALAAAVGAKAIDDKTVEYTLAQPNGRFTTIMSLWVTFPARLDVIDANGDAWTQPENIVTNGPFTMSELAPQDHVTLIPNPEWTGKEPALQEIQIRFIDDLSAGFRLFQTDELQLTRINATDIAVAEGDDELKDSVIIDPTARITAVQMQMEDETLADFNVRLALSRAIDRDALNEAVYDGVQNAATYWVVKGLKGHQGNEAFDDIIGFDLEAAQAALAEAGFPDGEGFPDDKTIFLRDTPEQRNLGDYLVKTWEDNLGITISAEFGDSKTRSERFNAENFDLFIGGWQLDYPDLENALLGLFDTPGGQNHYNCSNPKVDAALAKAVAATDDDARIEAYSEAETAIVTELCGVAPIFQDSLPFLVSTDLGGVVPNGTIDAGMPGNYCVECWFVKG
jgi:oligopeptide transport system substrate-binding protein